MLGWIIPFGIGVYVIARGIRALREYKEVRDPKICPGALLTCPPNAGTPNPEGKQIEHGRASSLDYQWCHVVKAGESAGSIALAVTGDAERYRELVATNKAKPTAISSTGEINFVALCVGERLLIPKSWNLWIDQYGKPRGSRVAYPPFDVMPSYPSPTTLTLGAIPTKEGGWS